MPRTFCTQCTIRVIGLSARLSRNVPYDGGFVCILVVTRRVHPSLFCRSWSSFERHQPDSQRPSIHSAPPIGHRPRALASSARPTNILTLPYTHTHVAECRSFDVPPAYHQSQTRTTHRHRLSPLLPYPSPTRQTTSAPYPLLPPSALTRAPLACRPLPKPIPDYRPCASFRARAPKETAARSPARPSRFHPHPQTRTQTRSNRRLRQWRPTTTHTPRRQRRLHRKAHPEPRP